MAFRIEKDSMGEVEVLENALYAAQTQRAINNFPISNLTMPREFIRALGLIKASCATANYKLNLIDKDISEAIIDAANLVSQGEYDDEFPVDVFQTGSGTSSNMNANEVIATLASKSLGRTVHPNDHVNMSQSSNDVIPTAIHISASLVLHEQLLPALKHLADTIDKRSIELIDVTKTGRTHLMDAMPVTLGQELSGYSTQIRNGINSLNNSKDRILKLAQGGTAVGTGINAHNNFGEEFAKCVKDITGLNFKASGNYFESLSSQDAIVEVSGQLKSIACSLMKISNDLRWMNSGPLAGFGEISLPSIQPGSSIMPGKVNPVIPEAVCMVCAQVIGNDTTITIAGQSGNFQLNVMLPVIAYNILQSLEILANGSLVLADSAIKGFTVNTNNINEKLSKNPILVTALNRVIGYELGAKIAKQAYKEQRPVLDVAQELTSLSRQELEKLLNPSELTKGGIKE